MIEAFLWSTVAIGTIELLLPQFQMFIQFVYQRLRRIILARIQVQMQYRVLHPVLFQLLYRQSFKQLPLSLHISFDRGKQQAFAEPAGTAQEIITARTNELIHQGGLVYIKIALFANLLKILDSYGINLRAHVRSFIYANVTKEFEKGKNYPYLHKLKLPKRSNGEVSVMKVALRHPDRSRRVSRYTLTSYSSFFIKNKSVLSICSEPCSTY